MVLSSRAGDWHDLPSFAECLRASMLLPGITGPPQRLPTRGEDLVDAMVFDSLAMRSAIAGGATHLLVTQLARPLVGWGGGGGGGRSLFLATATGFSILSDFRICGSLLHCAAGCAVQALFQRGLAVSA